MNADEHEIRQPIDRWAIWRDSGDWEKLLSVRNPGGEMKATWFCGSAAEFVAKSREAWSKGLNATHFVGVIKHRYMDRDRNYLHRIWGFSKPREKDNQAV